MLVGSGWLKVARVAPGDSGWLRVASGGLGWLRVASGGSRWLRVAPGGIQRAPGGSGRYPKLRVDVVSESERGCRTSILQREEC